MSVHKVSNKQNAAYRSGGAGLLDAADSLSRGFSTVFGLAPALGKKAEDALDEEETHIITKFVDNKLGKKIKPAERQKLIKTLVKDIKNNPQISGYVQEAEGDADNVVEKQVTIAEHTLINLIPGVGPVVATVLKEIPEVHKIVHLKDETQDAYKLGHALFATPPTVKEIQDHPDISQETKDVYTKAAAKHQGQELTDKVIASRQKHYKKAKDKKELEEKKSAKAAENVEKKSEKAATKSEKAKKAAKTKKAKLAKEALGVQAHKAKEEAKAKALLSEKKAKLALNKAQKSEAVAIAKEKRLKIISDEKERKAFLKGVAERPSRGGKKRRFKKKKTKKFKKKKKKTYRFHTKQRRSTRPQRYTRR